MLETCAEGIFGSPGWTGGNLRAAKFSNTYLKLMCDTVFGKKTLRECQK